MILTIKNQTSNPLSYLAGTVTVTANGNTTVTLAQLYPVCRDSTLINDCLNAIVNVSDGTVDYLGENATLYLNQIASSLGGAVVGYTGAAAPNFQITVGGKDPSSSSQPARMNQFADLSTNFRNTYRNLTGNATTTVKSSSGTLHGICINDNSTGGSIVVYDNTSATGAKIGTFQIGTPSGGLLSTAGTPVSSFLGPLGCEFTTGLTIVTSGSSSNNITIFYQ